MLDYHRPGELDQALGWLAERAAAGDRPVIAAGCTDLFPATERKRLPGPVLDITAIRGLRGIDRNATGWRFGATTTWTDVIRADLPPAFDGLKAAAREVGSVQIQNAATLAGNLCNASPAADGVPCWLTLAAEVELTSAAGVRKMPVQDFLTGPRQTALRPGEILTAIHVPASGGQGRSSFQKTWRAALSGDLHRHGGGADHGGGRQDPERPRWRSGRAARWRSSWVRSSARFSARTRARR